MNVKILFRAKVVVDVAGVRFERFDLCLMLAPCMILTAAVRFDRCFCGSLK